MFYLAAMQLPEADYLYVKDSQIPESGKGLYTAVAIFKDECIATFKGEILTQAQANLRAKQGLNAYFMSLPNGKILDAHNTEGFAKFANDATAFNGVAFKNNAKIVWVDNKKVALVATKNIAAGNEIFCHYGKRYWALHG